MKMYSKEGVEMMDTMPIARDGDNIVVKGRMMGAMVTFPYIVNLKIYGIL